MGVSVTLFFPNRPGGHTRRSILTQNGSNDVGSRKYVPFGVKIAIFETTDTQTPKTAKISQFWSALRKFSLDFAFNIGVSRVKGVFTVLTATCHINVNPFFFIGAQ